jgi:hypothetical protein
MNAEEISQTGSGGGDMPDGGAAQDADRAAALERRYKRLLRCYPPRHRKVHQEEMLGVLLAAARPGQRTPGARETANLVVSGLAIRARRALSWLAGESWQDALAVVSLVAPALMLVFAVLDFVAAAAPSRPPYTPRWQVDLVAPAVVAIMWLAVVLLGLTGWRRTAAAIAFVQFGLALVAPVGLAYVFSAGWFEGLGDWTPIAITNLAACSLAFSAGPRAGVAIVGRRAWLIVVGLAVCFGCAAIVLPLTSIAPWGSAALRLLAITAIAITIVLGCVRGAVDWRVAVLAAPTFLLSLVNVPFIAQGALLAVVIVLWLSSLALAVLVWPVAVASWWRRVRRPSQATAG